MVEHQARSGRTTASSISPCACPKRPAGPGGGTNPEQLFAAAYAACFHGALSLLAAKAEIAIVGAKVEVTVD